MPHFYCYSDFVKDGRIFIFILDFSFIPRYMNTSTATYSVYQIEGLAFFLIFPAALYLRFEA